MSGTKALYLLKYMAGVGGVLGSSVVTFSPNQDHLNSYGVVRLGRAAFTVFKISTIYCSYYFYANYGNCNPDDNRKLLSGCHKRGAEELLNLCCSNKGVYIKVGQHLAALDYLIPFEYVDTMKVLHSNGPSNNLEDVYKVIKEDLKRSPEELFKTIDPEPIGIASLAQVHKATLPDGTVVALKVQHSYVQGHTEVDMNCMEMLANVVGFVFPDFEFDWFVEEMKKNIPMELNFEHEGKNSEKIAEMLKGVSWLHIPKVRWDLTSPRVLTMDFAEGGHVNDLDYMKKQKIDPYEVSDKLGQLYSEMIFIHGFVHSDPHPGNILVKKSPKGGCDIILLDHGLYATLNSDFMSEYASFWLCILDRDNKGMKLHSKNLGIDGEGLYGLLACMVTGRSWSTIVNGLEKGEPTVEEKRKVQSQLPEVFPYMMGILQRVNRQMYLIFKTNGLVHGIEHTLRTRSRKCTFKTMSQCCVRSVYSRKIDNSKTTLDKFKVTVTQYWILFKLNVYYTISNLTDMLKIIGI